MARYVWQQASTRTASENKEQLQNILGQRVIVTKGFINTMCRLLKRHNDITQGDWAKVWKAKTAYWYIVWATQMPNSNTNNTNMKTTVKKCYAPCKHLRVKKVLVLINH